MKHLVKALDKFGLPLTEGVDIELDFEHDGKKAVAIFELSGGSRLKGSREFPPETEDPDVQFTGAFYKEDDNEIDYKEIDPQQMEQLIDNAIAQYWDLEDRGEIGPD